MASNSAFQIVDERGWRRGVGNLMSAGFGSWWRTNTWWIHALIWTGVINGLIAGILWGADSSSETGVAFLSIAAGLFPTIAVVIIMMGEVVGEKKSGTAAWVLSKPVSREAFILSKWVPNIVGCVVTMILLPGLVAYVQIALAGEPVRPIGYLGGPQKLSIWQTEGDFTQLHEPLWETPWWLHRIGDRGYVATHLFFATPLAIGFGNNPFAVNAEGPDRQPKIEAAGNQLSLVWSHRLDDPAIMRLHDWRAVKMAGPHLGASDNPAILQAIGWQPKTDWLYRQYLVGVGEKAEDLAVFDSGQFVEALFADIESARN